VDVRAYEGRNEVKLGPINVVSGNHMNEDLRERSLPLQFKIMDALPVGAEGELLALALVESLAEVIARCAPNPEESAKTFADGLIWLVSARLKDRAH